MGNLFLAESEDLVYFTPDSIVINRHIPRIEFTESQLSGNNIETKLLLIGKDTLNVDPVYKNIRIEFVALDFWDPRKMLICSRSTEQAKMKNGYNCQPKIIYLSQI